MSEKWPSLSFTNAPFPSRLWIPECWLHCKHHYMWDISSLAAWSAPEFMDSGMLIVVQNLKQLVSVTACSKINRDWFRSLISWTVNCSSSESVLKRLSCSCCSGDKLWERVMGEYWGSYSELPYVHRSISYFQSVCQYSGLITPKKVGRTLYIALSSFSPCVVVEFLCVCVFPTQSAGNCEIHYLSLYDEQRPGLALWIALTEPGPAI